MIAIDENTKNEYKQLEREFDVVGNLYIAKKRVSKNLFNYRTTTNGWINQNNVIQNSGLASYCYSDYVKVNPNTTYTLDLYNKTGLQSGAVLEYNTSKTFLNLSILETQQIITFTTSSNTNYVRFTCRQDSQQKVQFQEGTSIINDEEYGTLINDYNTLGSEYESKNKINVRKLFSRFYDEYKDVFYFEKYDEKYVETDFINMSDIGARINVGNCINYNVVYNKNNEEITISVAGYDSNNTIKQIMGTNQKIILGKTHFQFTFSDSSITKFKIRFNETNENSSNDIAINDVYFLSNWYAKRLPYQEYNTTPFPLTQDNNCKILSFNINENSDIYLTSFPYNTMTIEVDNEEGYFSDYTEKSIVNMLNTDCYIELFIKINNGYYYRIMRMDFDKITSSDYEKATLSFKSNISTLRTLVLKDKTNLIQYDYWLKRRTQEYLKKNYNISYVSPGIGSSTHSVYWIDSDIWGERTSININTVEDMILQEFAMDGGRTSTEFIFNNANNQIQVNTFKNDSVETILRDYQLEKSLLKREDHYRGVLRKRITKRNWEQTNETFNLVLTGKFTSEIETRMIRNNDYKVNTLTTNDVSITNGTLLNVYTNNNVAEGAVIEFSGNIGDDYTITINKENVIKNVSQTYGEDYIGDIDDTTKILQINENSPFWQMYYYHYILEAKHIKSYLETRLMALPYIELGDTVEVETELARVPIMITSITMNYDGGLTQTIKGYELDWEDENGGN